MHEGNPDSQPAVFDLTPQEIGAHPVGRVIMDVLATTELAETNGSADAHEEGRTVILDATRRIMAGLAVVLDRYEHAASTKPEQPVRPPVSRPPTFQAIVGDKTAARLAEEEKQRHRIALQLRGPRRHRRPI
jgi:hypothetical protein